ncbi:MAG: DUF2163 domain-containing protein [Pseudolabrys sp.]|nr:DUF2163 domain-containing protein [Pseudolabrys sp.]
MKNIPPALQARLDSGVTTLCRCWRIVRNDGAVQGFTDHDEDIVVDGVTCRAGTGFVASEAKSALGLAVGGLEVSGALSDASLNEADLAAGRYDAAAVEQWLVDWSAPELKVLLMRGVLGEVRRDGAAFTAEVRGLADRLAQESGRLYTAACTADLGDARCAVDLDDPAFRGEGSVSATASVSSFRATGLDAFADGWFTGGRLLFTTGANAGQAIEIKSHRLIGGIVTLDLWQTMPEAIMSGDGFAATAGCDKRFATCTAKFANAMNFRGFPHIPGNDFIVRYPLRGEPGNDGSSLQG